MVFKNFTETVLVKSVNQELVKAIYKFLPTFLLPLDKFGPAPSLYPNMNLIMRASPPSHYTALHSPAGHLPCSVYSV